MTDSDDSTELDARSGFAGEPLVGRLLVPLTRFDIDDADIDAFRALALSVSVATVAQTRRRCYSPNSIRATGRFAPALWLAWCHSVVAIARAQC